MEKDKELICPEMSLRSRIIKCKREKCAWWIEENNTSHTHGCAIKVKAMKP